MDEFLFEYKNDIILNINDVVRREIRKIYEKEILRKDNSFLVMEDFKTLFLRMYEEDRKSYNLYIQIMMADMYKMLVNELKQNTINESQLMSYSILNNFDLNPDNILSYINTSAGIFEEMIESSIAFENLNLLGRKTVVQNSRDYDVQITKISPLYVLDVLNYGEKTTTNELLQYYVKTLDLIITEPDLLVSNILSHMKHLYTFNQDNYLENVREMCKVFYKWRKFVLSRIEKDLDSTIIRYLKMIEEKNISDLGNTLIFDNDFLFQIIDDFCYFSSISQIKVENEYFTEDMVDKFIDNKFPSSLSSSVQKRKK